MIVKSPASRTKHQDIKLCGSINGGNRSSYFFLQRTFVLVVIGIIPVFLGVYIILCSSFFSPKILLNKSSAADTRASSSTNIASIGQQQQQQQQQVSTTMTISPCQSEIDYKLVEEGNNGRYSFTRYAAYCNKEPVSIHAWIQANMIVEVVGMQSRSTIRAPSSSIATLIRDSSYTSVFFESKGCTAANAKTKQFEFVLVDAPSLKSFVERTGPDENAFREHFPSSSNSNNKTAAAVAFSNLGGTARLIAPTPPLSERRCSSSTNCVTPLVAYSHLAAFCRQAPSDQVTQVWQLAAREYHDTLEAKATSGDDSPVWFSTSGTGIAWLHFRLDRRPKYYTYKPFKSEM